MTVNEKAIKIENRLRAIRKEMMFKNEITRYELLSLVNDLDMIEDSCFKILIKDIDFPYTSVMTNIGITKSYLLRRLTEII